MGIRSISWHKQCLENQKASLLGYEQELHYLIEKVKRVKADVCFYTKQIERAEKEKRNGFDRDWL